MYYGKINDNNNTRTVIDNWLGYNHNFKANRGEFFDMQNLSSDNYPLASPRRVRSRLMLIDEDGAGKFRGIICIDGDIYALKGKVLSKIGADEMTTDLSDYFDEDDDISEQTMLQMGSYILMYPSGVYVNLKDTEDVGRMDVELDLEDAHATYTPCTADGGELQNLTASFLEPEDFEPGDYWICTNPDKRGLYMYNGYLSMWEAVPTCYIKISISGTDFSEYFNAGDAVFMNTKFKDLNNGSVLVDSGNGYLIVIGLIDAATDSETNDLHFERKIPKMDFVCVDKNRVWGCRYGYQDGKQVNEIYASKLGDFKNFYVYQGLTTDSYSVSVGELGKFTGCVSFQGCPVFFKENKIYKIYGAMPSEYTLNEINAEGVQQGSSKSMVVIGEYLLYKGVNSILIYDGSWPTAIGSALGRGNLFYDGIAGGCHNKYYLTLTDERVLHHMFVYDIELGIWEKESYLPFMQFSNSVNGQLFGITDDTLWGLGNTDNEVYLREERIDEEWVEWYAVTGELGFEYPDYKYVSRLTLRAYLDTRSEIQIEVSYDDRPYEKVATMRGIDDISQQSFAFSPLRCDHFRIKFSGHGYSRIYSLAMTYDTESEEDAYY